MIEGIWRSLQRRFILSAVRRVAKKSSSQQIEMLEAWEGVNRILVFWPGNGMDVISARVVLNRIRERFPDALLAVLALPGVGASPPSEVDAEVITIQKEELTFFGIPRKPLRLALQESGYDAVVDLSPRFEPLAAYLCLATAARLRIGFACATGDLAYNYQISPRADRTGIDRYRVLARYIG